MLLQSKIRNLITCRTFKNFGHKRQPIPLITTLWHGSLTLCFTGMCLNWKKISIWVFGEENKLEADRDVSENSSEVL